MGLAAKLHQAQTVAAQASHALNSVPGGQKPHSGYPPASGAGYPGQQAPPSGYPAQGSSGQYPGQQYPAKHGQPGGFPTAPGQYPGQQPQQHGGQGAYSGSTSSGQYSSQTQSHTLPGQYTGQAPAGQTQVHVTLQQYGGPAGHSSQSASGSYGSQQQAGQYGSSSYGATQQSGYGGAGGAYSNTGALSGVLQNKLRQMIQVNRLDCFYPPNSPQLNQLFSTVNSVDFKAMAARYNMPLELATEMVTLALYDIVIFCDDSGSMQFEESGERVNDLKVILGRVAEVATNFDTNGINIRFMNCNVQGNNIRDSISASNLVSQVQFNGLTPLGSKLDEKVMRPFIVDPVQSRSLQKPVLVIVITDGEPTGEAPNTVLNVIKGVKQMVSNSQYGPGAVGIEFSQVGKDMGAQRFLATLDKDPEVGKNIDATSYYEMEQEEYARKGVTLTPDLWLMKLMVGAVDPTFDEQD